MSMKGRAKLASVLQKRMKSVSDFGTNVNSELGTITAGFGLKLDSMPNVTIKKSEYFVCRGVQYVANYIKSNVDEASSIQTDILKPGDRVLVMWTYDGEIVVVDKIITASSL